MAPGEQLLHRNVQRFRGGLVFKAHRLLYDSTLSLGVIKKTRWRSSALSIDSCWWSSAGSGGDLYTYIYIYIYIHTYYIYIIYIYTYILYICIYIYTNCRFQRKGKASLEWEDGTRWRSSALSIESCRWSSAGWCHPRYSQA